MLPDSVLLCLLSPVLDKNRIGLHFGLEIGFAHTVGTSLSRTQFSQTQTILSWRKFSVLNYQLCWTPVILIFLCLSWGLGIARFNSLYLYCTYILLWVCIESISLQVCIQAKWPIRLDHISCNISSTKQLGVFLLYLNVIAVHSGHPGRGDTVRVCCCPRTWHKVPCQGTFLKKLQGCVSFK